MLKSGEAIIDKFVSVIDPEPTYMLAFEMGTWVATYLGPLILLVALVVRITGDTLSSISSNGKWLLFLKDFVVTLLLWASYLGFMFLIKDVFDFLNQHIGRNGAYSSMFDQMSSSIEQARAKDSGWMKIFDLTKVVGLLTPFLYIAFYITYVVVLALFCFLNIAHAALFSIVYVWGIVAIAVSFSKYANIMRGWIIMTAIILVWPLVEGLLFYFISSVINTGLEAVLGDVDASDKTSWEATAQLLTFWTIMNCLMVGLAMVAPFVTQSLITNSGSVAGNISTLGLSGSLGAAAVAYGGADLTKKAATGALKAGMKGGGKLLEKIKSKRGAKKAIPTATKGGGMGGIKGRAGPAAANDLTRYQRRYGARAPRMRRKSYPRRESPTR